MNLYEINFENSSTYWIFYGAIISGMHFPDWCGKNADAIWDMLTTHIKTPAIIYLKNINGISRELEEEKNIIFSIFSKIENWYKEINKSVKIIFID